VASRRVVYYRGAEAKSRQLSAPGSCLLVHVVVRTTGSRKRRRTVLVSQGPSSLYAICVLLLQRNSRGDAISAAINGFCDELCVGSVSLTMEIVTRNFVRSSTHWDFRTRATRPSKTTADAGRFSRSENRRFRGNRRRSLLRELDRRFDDCINGAFTRRGATQGR